MTAMSRWEPFRNLNTLQEQVNRLFDDSFARTRSGEADLASWAPAVDVYETENELVVKADLPDMQEKDIDVRVENNTLTIRGERKFSNEAHQDNYLRVERAYGTFTRSFSLPNVIKTEGIRAEYQNGVLSVHMPKREESKPKQVKISVSANGKK
jgi:HSP20 family protein